MRTFNRKPERLYEVFKTTDKRLYEHFDLAELHQSYLDYMDEIIELLGGSAFEVDKQFPGFLFGHGYVLIQQSDFDKAVALSNELLANLDMQDVSFTSRIAYDNEFFGQISAIMMCLHHVHDEIHRYGQSYYANNPQCSKGINFSKKEFLNV